MDSDGDEDEDERMDENADDCSDAGGDAGKQKDDRDSSSGEEERAKLERSLHEDDEKDDPRGAGNPWLRKTFFEEIKCAPAATTGSKTDTAAAEESSENSAGRNRSRSKPSKNDDKPEDEIQIEPRRGSRRVLEVPVSLSVKL